MSTESTEPRPSPQSKALTESTDALSSSSLKWTSFGSLGLAIVALLMMSIFYFWSRSPLSLPTYHTLLTTPSDHSLGGSAVKDVSKNTRLHVASTPHTNTLIRRIFALGYEGRFPLPIVHESVDQAALAVCDGLIQGALSLSARPSSSSPSSSSSSPSPSPSSPSSPPPTSVLTLGSTPVHWVSRGEETALSSQAFEQILNQDFATWKNGQPFQFALRALPSPLEEAWFARNPEWEKRIKSSALYQTSPRFYSEEKLLRFLRNTPGSIGLMETARVRLRGLPVRLIQIERAQVAYVYLQFHLPSFERVKRMAPHLSDALGFWVQFFQSDQFQFGLNEWGWRHTL